MLDRLIVIICCIQGVLETAWCDLEEAISSLIRRAT